MEMQQQFLLRCYVTVFRPWMAAHPGPERFY